MPSLNEEVYAVLRENLVAVDPGYAEKDVVLCPICLRGIGQAEVLVGGIEHIIPRVVADEDSVDDKARATRNQRCGITLLSRQQRVCKSDGYVSKGGCNGLKGRLYDRLFKGFFDDGPHSREKLAHQHGVGILMMGYLAAFQFFGYEFILRREMDEIREQFDYPIDRKTPYLDQALYCLAPSNSPPLVTESGQPFVWGGIKKPDAPLHLMFRRCQVELPGGHWQLKEGVRHLVNLIRKIA
jgi:hypothetical protein